MPPFHQAAPIALALAFVACDSSPSEESDLPPTDQLAPSFVASADSSNLLISAALIADGRERELPKDARLIASVGESRVPLTLTSQASFYYEARVPGPREESTVTFIFERASGASAAGSSVVLPAPFEVVEAPRSVRAGSELSIRLSRSTKDGEIVTLLLDGCSAPRTFTSNGTGDLATFALLDLNPVSDCEAKATVTIGHDGVVDPAFARTFELGEGLPPQPARTAARQVRTMSLQVQVAQ